MFLFGCCFLLLVSQRLDVQGTQRTLPLPAELLYIYFLIKNLKHSAPCCSLSPPQVWTRKDSPPQPAASSCWLSCFLSSCCSWSVTPSPALRHVKINEDSYYFPDAVVLGTGTGSARWNPISAGRRCFRMDGSDLIGWLCSPWAWTGSVLLTSTLHRCLGSLTPATNFSHWTSDIPTTGSRCICSCYSFNLNFNRVFFSFFPFCRQSYVLRK